MVVTTGRRLRTPWKRALHDYIQREQKPKGPSPARQAPGPGCSGLCQRTARTTARRSTRRRHPGTATPMLVLPPADTSAAA